MPNKSDTIITELDDQLIGNGPTYSYSALTIDSNRSHASQIQILFYYTTLGDGTSVDDVEFANWYTPYVVPQLSSNNDVILTFDQTTRTVTIGDLTKVTVRDVDGVEYNLPPFNEGTKVRILRSQNVTNKSQVFGAGSRVTSIGLNNAIDQVFNSIQELDTRVNNIEGANFEQGIILNLEDIPLISVEKGGTGASSAPAARAALGINDASNLTTGTLNSDRLTNVPMSKLSGTLQNDQLQESNVTQFATEVGNAINLNDLADVNATPVSNGSLLSYNDALSKWVPSSPSAGAGDHGNLSGLSDDDHTQYALADGTRGDFAATSHTHDASAITSGTFSISLIPDLSGTYSVLGHSHTLSDITDAGTAAASNTGDFEASGSIATHAALTSGVHGISTFAATILDDVDATAVRTTISAAATNHTHAASQITSGTFSDACIASSNVTQHAADINIQDLGNVVPGLLSDNLFLAYDNSTSNWTGRSPAAARTALNLGTAATSDTGDFATASQGSLADSALQDVVDDTTPQLGGNLDVNGQSIVSASNGNIAITPNGTGKVVLDGLSWPTSDGTTDQVLKTDGSGNLSFATVSGGGGGTTDWILTPSNTQVVRLFDDFLAATGRKSARNSPFFGLGTFSGYWQDSYGMSAGSGETGVIRAITQTSLYARLPMLGTGIYPNDAADGTEWLFEGRFLFEFDTNVSNSPLVSFGAFCPTTDHSENTTEQGPGYGDTAKAGIYWDKLNTYWKSYHADTEGTNGDTTEADLTTFTPAEDTWFRIAVHAKKETIFTVPTWTIKVYIDGTLATTQYLTSGTEAPTFYCALMNDGTAYSNSMYVDWVMLQYTRPTAVTYIDIEDL